MSTPDRRPVRLRRSPRIGAFLTLGVLVGVVVAVLIALLTPADGQYPTSQVVGFMVLICAPVGAALGGLAAVALDGIATRRARVLEAERIDEGAPRVDVTAPLVDEPAPRRDEPAPRRDEPAPRLDEPAPRIDAPAPRVDD